jgi:hypothetical protein
MADIMDGLMEQIDAARDVVHLHRCVLCQIATAQEIVVLVSDEPGGARVMIVGVCNTCKEDEDEIR